MYHTTGFSHDEVVDLCVLINSVERAPDAMKWPPILGLFKSVTVTLAYMRHNRTQSEIGDSFGVSQPTISRAISAITPFIAEGLRGQVPTAEELDLARSKSWTGHCFPAGHGPRTRNSTRESIRPPA